jgi:hypothetical protein
MLQGLMLQGLMRPRNSGAGGGNTARASPTESLAPAGLFCFMM